MNYRHAFHAGNFADVFKHVLLTRMLLYLMRKSTPLRYIETHAGRGLYDLAGGDPERTQEWREAYGKPVVNDEPEYEGNIIQSWGNLTAQELVHRFWLTMTRGGYAGHGETYAHPEDLIWWAKGGELRGEAWKRIGFMRDLLEQDVTHGLEPLGKIGDFPWTRCRASVTAIFA